MKAVFWIITIANVVFYYQYGKPNSFLGVIGVLGVSFIALMFISLNNPLVYLGIAKGPVESSLTAGKKAKIRINILLVHILGWILLALPLIMLYVKK